MKNLLLIPLLALMAACAPPEAGDYVEVSGEGTVEAVADVFRVHATASARGDDVEALRQRVDAQVAEVLAALDEAGIPERDITALALSVQPEWQWQPERQLIGYVASRNLDIVLRGMAPYEQVLAILTRAGLSEIRPGTSEVSDRDALRERALEAAMADARARAEVLARAGGRELGAVRLIVESGAHFEQPRLMEMATMARDQKAYTPGTTTVTARVQVRFALQ